MCCPKNVELVDQEALVSLCCTERPCINILRNQSLRLIHRAQDEGQGGPRETESTSRSQWDLSHFLGSVGESSAFFQ